MISEKNFDFTWYTLECVVGLGLGYLIQQNYHIIGTWCMFSILLVVSPDHKDAVNLAVNRINANIIGAFVGLGLLYFYPITFPMLALGTIVTLISCEMLKLQHVARSAMIAVLIITSHEQGKHFWDVALERASGVIVGCIIGVALTYSFHHIVKASKKKLNLYKKD